jgi:hypothetical protein
MMMKAGDLTKKVLESEGLQGATRVLNAHVPHRYTGVFLKDGALLRNVALFDKQDPTPALWAPFPVGDSFCSLIIASGQPLTIIEATVDTRGEVRAHPAAKIVQAYCGVPLIDSDGITRGTLCHFDEHAINDDVDLEQMLRIPPMLLPYVAARPKSSE